MGKFLLHGFEEKSGVAINTGASPSTNCTFDATHLHQIAGVGGDWALKTNAVGSAVAEQKLLMTSATTGRLVAINKNAVYIRIYVYPGTLPGVGEGEQDFCALQQGTNRILDVRVLPDGSLKVYDFAGNLLGTSATSIIAIGAFYRIDLKLTGANSSNASWAVRLNSNEVVSGSGYSLTGKQVESLSVGKKTNRTGDGSVVAWWDDILGDDTDYPLDGIIKVKKPIANGSRVGNAGWSPVGAVNQWDCLDDIPYTTGTRLEENVIDRVYTAGMKANADLSISGSIQCAKAQIVGNPGAGGGLKVLTHQNSVDVEITNAYSSTTSDDFLGKLLETAPDGSAWTLTKLDQAEVGGHLTTAPTSGVAKIHDAYLQVDFNPVSAPSAPTISSPSNGGNVATGTITLTHNLPSGATQFRARVDGGAWSIFNDTNLTHDVSATEANGAKGDHTIDLQAGTSGVWSASTTITVHVYGLPLAPSDGSRAPASGTHQNENTDIVFSWQNLNAATVPADKYELIVNDGTNDVITQSALTNPTYTKTGGLAAGSFTWKVRTHNSVSLWGPFSSNFTFFADAVTTWGDLDAAVAVNMIVQAMASRMNLDSQGGMTVATIADGAIDSDAIAPNTFKTISEMATAVKGEISSTPYKAEINPDGSIKAAVADKAGFGLDPTVADSIAVGASSRVLSSFKLDAEGRIEQAYFKATITSVTSATVITTDRTEADGVWDDCIVRVRTGALAGAFRRVQKYEATGGKFTLKKALSGLVAGVELDLVNV